MNRPLNYELRWFDIAVHTPVLLLPAVHRPGNNAGNRSLRPVSGIVTNLIAVEFIPLSADNRNACIHGTAKPLSLTSWQHYQMVTRLLLTNIISIRSERSFKKSGLRQIPCECHVGIEDHTPAGGLRPVCRSVVHFFIPVRFRLDTDEGTGRLTWGLCWRESWVGKQMNRSHDYWYMQPGGTGNGRPQNCCV